MQEFITGIKNYRTLLNDRSRFLFLFGMIMGAGRGNRKVSAQTATWFPNSEQQWTLSGWYIRHKGKAQF